LKTNRPFARSCVHHLWGKILSHRLLLKEVGGPHSLTETYYLRVFVANLRKKLERDSARPRIIITEPGVGDRLADPLESIDDGNERNRQN